MSVAARAAVVALVKSVIGSLPLEEDSNVPFAPPVDAPWARVTFKDGDEQRFPGQGNQLVRRPLLAFLDFFAPLGFGEGAATAGADSARDALRGVNLVDLGIRFVKVQEGTEGRSGAYYGKQIIIVYRQSFRV